MIEAQTSHKHGNADYLGITGSVLCIIHCIATPILAVSSSIVFKDSLMEGMHALGFLFILINGIAVFFAVRHAHSEKVKKFLWFAFAVFSVSIILEEAGEVFHYLSYLGSVLLITGHSLNLYISRRAHRS